MTVIQRPLTGGILALICSAATAMAAGVVTPSLDPTEYFESLQVGSFNQVAASYLNRVPGSFALACDPNEVFPGPLCSTVTLSNQPDMSVTAGVTAYPQDPSNQTHLSSYSQLTGEIAYFYEVVGPANSAPVPLVLNTYVSFLVDLGNDRSYSIQGAAETRLDGITPGGATNPVYAISDSTRAPHNQLLTNYARTNTEYDIALIASGLTAYNNGTLGFDSPISISVFIDPVLSFAPGFDSTGYSLVFSDGVPNGATPEPSTLAMLGGAACLCFGYRRRRNR